MKKTYKQIFIVLAVSVFIVPQIVLAAWWNPLSWSIWNIFRPTPHVEQIQIATTTPATPTATTAKKVDANIKQEEPTNNKDLSIESAKKTVVDSTQKVSQPNIKQSNVAVPSQPIPTPVPSCTQDTWSCSDWLVCSSSGSQTRSCNKTFECPSVVTQSPITSQSCTPPVPSCQVDTWSCDDCNSCSTSGNQTRSCTKTFECPSINTPTPILSQSCTPPAPTCQSDTWECGNWNSCSSSGSQSRICNKTFDCSSIITPSPNTSQSCTPPVVVIVPPENQYSDYIFNNTSPSVGNDSQWQIQITIPSTVRDIRVKKAVFKVSNEDATTLDSIGATVGGSPLWFGMRYNNKILYYTSQLQRTDKNTFTYEATDGSSGISLGQLPLFLALYTLSSETFDANKALMANITMPMSEWIIMDQSNGKQVKTW